MDGPSSQRSGSGRDGDPRTVVIQRRRRRRRRRSPQSLMPRYAGPSPSSMSHEQISIRDDILSSRPRTGLAGPFGPWLSVPNIARPSQLLGRAVRYGTSLSFRETELVILLTGARFDSVTEFDIHAKEARAAGIGWDVIRSIPGGMLLEGNDEEEEEGGVEEEDNDEDDDDEEDDAGGFSLTSVMERTIPTLIREHREGGGEGGAHITPPVIGMTRDEVMEREVSIVLFASELLDTNTVSDETYRTTRERLDGRHEALVEITAIVGYYAYVSYTLNVFRIPSDPCIGPVEGE